MDKRATVIESIQKLIQIGVSDNEIAENLYDVGIEKNEAFSLIREARDALEGKKIATQIESAKVTQDVSPKVVRSSVVTDNSADTMDEEIVKQIPIEKKIVPEEPSEVKTQIEGVDKKIVPEVANQKEDNITTQLESVKRLEEQFPKKKFAVKEPLAPPTPSVNASKEPVTQKEEGIPSLPKESVEEGAVPHLSIDQILAEADQTDNQKPSKEGETKPVVNQIPARKSVKSVSMGLTNESSLDFEELWKKGIVVAVNAKLSEMKQLKEEIDSELAQKVDEAVRKELMQYRVLMESQKELIISSNNEALDQKQKEISFIIDSKIAELKQYNKQLSENLAALDSARRQQELALQQINQALSDAKKTKAQLVVEMNSELIKSKSQAQAFIDSATSHLNQMDERINKALELEKNIAEGMLAQAEQKIESLTLQKADDLIEEAQVELNKLKASTKSISPEAIDQKIKLLDDFKKEFLASMQQNLAQINSAIDDLNQRNIIAEQALQEKTLAIDAKLEELTKFEKRFTEKLEKLVANKN